jgi:hypothetical protein
MIKLLSFFEKSAINSCAFHPAKRTYSAPSLGMFVCGRVYNRPFFEFVPTFFTSRPEIRGKIANYSDFFCMSGGGRFCRVIRHIANHFWINTADYVTAERNLPQISKGRLCRGKSRESETRP